MARAKLTELSVTKMAPPTTGRKEVWDAAMPGFGLRVTASGIKTFMTLYRIHGRVRRLTIGRHPVFTVAAARTQAREALQKVERGIDPAFEKVEAKHAPVETFEEVRDLFIERYAKHHNRSWAETEKTLKRECSAWDKRPIKDIKKRDVIAVLDSIMDRGKQYAANRTLAAVRKLFNWSLSRDIIDASPVSGIKAPGSEAKRDRVLSDDELLSVWSADAGWPTTPMLRLLILTAQRKEEVARMRWSSIAEGVWNLSRDETKADRKHSVPLSPEVQEILESLPRINGSDFVFPSQSDAGSTTISSKRKQDIDRASGVTDWRLHDIRRSVATGMRRMGVDRDVVKMVLNHVQNDVTSVYDVYQGDAEKKAALDLWARHVTALSEPVEGNVVELRA